jgi:hypothetical protein
VLEELNKQMELSIPGAKLYSLQQAQDRVELLKKNHKKEADKKTSTGSVASRWVAFFQAMDDILGTSSKVTGVPGAFTGQRAVPYKKASSAPAATIDLDEPSSKQTIDVEDETAGGQGEGQIPSAKRRHSKEQLMSNEEGSANASADVPPSAKRAAKTSSGGKTGGTEEGSSPQDGSSTGPVKKEGEDVKPPRKLVKEGVRGQKTRAASIGGSSPNAAAKALMGGLKECVGMLLQDMKEDRAQRSALENRKLDQCFRAWLHKTHPEALRKTHLEGLRKEGRLEGPRQVSQGTHMCTQGSKTINGMGCISVWLS